ncbi:hypothetical protein, partial [Acinetobacter baumannii]|uniref:hypothetical protein n=1 Tax=Acinetobacter baumannii TaxID=470 RepID=UPI0005B4F885
GLSPEQIYTAQENGLKIAFLSEQRTENREQRTENREQRTENRAYINKFRYWSNLELKFYYRKQKSSFYP